MGPLFFRPFRAAKPFSGSVQSVCADLLGKSTGLDLLRFNLKGLRRQINIQWVPRHSNILGNVIADYVAKQACSKNTELPGVNYTSICVIIK